MKRHKRHTVTQAELDEWLRTPQWQRFASSFSAISNKGLEIDAAAPERVFRVLDHGETKFIGADMAAAIAAYNDAP
jgi:hypothetical protein